MSDEKYTNILSVKISGQVFSNVTITLLLTFITYLTINFDQITKHEESEL